jgi:hypothetical protein
LCVVGMRGAMVSFVLGCGGPELDVIGYEGRDIFKFDLRDPQKI